MTSNKFKYACFSDIHLGHPRTSTDYIIKSLKQSMKDNRVYESVDAIIFAGDVFDRLLELNNDYLNEIDLWMAEVIHNCSVNNVMLIVLEGTKSHDRGQNERWLTINSIMGHNACKLHYIHTLSIEYFRDWNMHILFVPDDWSTDSKDTLEQVKALMKAKGLDKVDLSIMHGQFKHQLPEFISLKSSVTHDNDAYLNLTKHYVMVGHIHTHSVYDRILAQGSFERLAHGEEEPKGFIIAEIDLDDVDKDWFSFIVNPRAKVYKTIDCHQLSLEEALNYIKDQIQDLNDGSYVRVQVSKDSAINTNMKEVMALAPLIKWSKQVKDHELQTIEKENAKQELLQWQAIKVDQHNLIETVIEELKANQVHPFDYEIIIDTLNRLK